MPPNLCIEGGGKGGTPSGCEGFKFGGLPHCLLFQLFSFTSKLLHIGVVEFSSSCYEEERLWVKGRCTGPKGRGGVAVLVMVWSG